MNPEFSPQRSAAIRAELISAVESTAAQRLAGRPHRWLATLGVLTAGMLIGGAVSAAAFTLGGNDDRSVGVVVDGVVIGSVENPLPGQNVPTVLGDTRALDVSGNVRVPLIDAPVNATHLRITSTCLSEGRVSWGLDPGGNNPSSSCGVDPSKWTTAFFDFPLTSTAEAIYINADPGASLRLSYTYLSVERKPLGVNDSGQTYGVDHGDGETPDLVPVTAQDADGNRITGYVYASELYAFGPDHPNLPSNPEEAIRWQNERNEKYPNGWDLPVYESDGRTQIGTYHVQNG